MRSAIFTLLLVAGLGLAAPVSAQPQLISPDIPLPGLSEEIDQSLWCATMTTQLARAALEKGDEATFELLAPIAAQLSQQVSTFFVVLHFGEPDIATYTDLYQAEITAVLAGTAPERYAPIECQGALSPLVVA